MIAVTQNQVTEWSFSSGRKYADPFNDVDLSVVFEGEGGARTVPAFWAGESTWRVRFSSPVFGRRKYRTVCSDTSNPDLHGLEGEFDVVHYTGDNPLFLHGPVQVAPDKRHFQHTDGAPFFWLADTWWMGLCKRMDWPRGFQSLAMDRVDKGFSVIQIIMGLYPDMAAFDERGVNEAGFPWEKDYARINPSYFDYADRRIAYLVESGLSPCIVGCWGYFLPLMGIEKMKKHWRYLIARYGAYPVFWCLAGEQTMPYYLSPHAEEDTKLQRQGWSEIASYVRASDPFRRAVTVHPGEKARDQMADPSLVDFEMLQTGHGDRVSLPDTVRWVTEAVAREPKMPVIDSEVCYEGIGEACRQEVQRLMFWACILNGAAGHTYGANGIWQVNEREKPYGPSPHGLAWGDTPWEEAAQLPGSLQVGIGKRILENYEWWRFEPHPEWVEGHWTAENYFGAHAAGVPRKTRVIYWPPVFFAGTVKGIESDVSYHATLISPVDGKTLDLGPVVPDENGDWPLPLGTPRWRVMPCYQDWVLVLEAR